MTEIWKDIEGYEGKYQISNLGNVKSIFRVVKSGVKHTTTRIYEEKIMKQSLNRKGYCIISLYSNNGLKNNIVHRLVANAFIPNPHNLPQVNHKDENKLNNTVENLEWCDAKYNNNYGSRNLKHSKSKSEKIIQKDLNGKFIKEWESATEVERQLGYDASSIRKCCLNKAKTAYKFLWERKVV